MGGMVVVSTCKPIHEIPDHLGQQIGGSLILYIGFQPIEKGR